MGNCWLGGGTAVGSKEPERAKQKRVPTRPVAATLEASKERRDKVQLISSGLQ